MFKTKGGFFIFLGLGAVIAVVGMLFFTLLQGVSKPQTPTPSRAEISEEPTSDSTTCQGNENAPAKCLSCKIDQDDQGQDEVNIYDFACFASWYGDPVGT